MALDSLAEAGLPWNPLESCFPPPIRFGLALALCHRWSWEGRRWWFVDCWLVCLAWLLGGLLLLWCVRAWVLVYMAFEPWLGRSLSSDLVWLLMLLVSCRPAVDTDSPCWSSLTSWVELFDCLWIQAQLLACVAPEACWLAIGMKVKKGSVED